MFRGFSGDVPRVFQGCFEGVQGDILRVFRGYFGDVGCSKGVLGEVQGCFGCSSGAPGVVLRVFLGCSEGVLILFRGGAKPVF